MNNDIMYIELKKTQRQWTQTLNSNGKTIKNHFFNPIMQNELHIKWLMNVLSDYLNIIYHSFILFSDRCTLKKNRAHD